MTSPEVLTVDEDAEGERLDVFLAELAGSRAAAQRLIEAGLVRVDGEARPKRHVVRAGERVEIAEDDAPPPEPRPDAEFRVAFSDDHLLIVDKPAGVVVHPGRGNETGTLVQALGDRVGGGTEERRPGVVHRLDRDTSGLIVFARGQEAWEALSDMIRRRAVTREYAALVIGRPPARTGTIDAPIGRDRRVRTRISTETDDPREAITHFEITEALPNASLLRVRLETGRTHQIRAHFRAIGHPIAGDPEYGTPGQYGLDRQFLHAQRLAFAHPFGGAPVDVTSPLPADLARALALARDE